MDGQRRFVSMSATTWKGLLYKLIEIKKEDLMFPTISKELTGFNLKKLMTNRGLSVKDIQQYLHLGSVQSVYYWLNGTCLPSVDNLYALSQLFQVPIDDIIVGTGKNLRYKHLYEYQLKWLELCVA